MTAACRLILAFVLGVVVVACDKGSAISVKNETDLTYVAQVGDGEFLVIPPKQHLTIAAVGFTGPRLPVVQVLDAGCAPVGEPKWNGGTFTIASSGTVTFSSEVTGEFEVNAQASRFCAAIVPAPSGSPTPSPSGPGPP